MRYLDRLRKAVKTNRERAEYLSFICPEREEIYHAIAVFLGEDELASQIRLSKKK